MFCAACRICPRFPALLLALKEKGSGRISNIIFNFENRTHFYPQFMNIFVPFKTGRACVRQKIQLLQQGGIFWWPFLGWRFFWEGH